MNIDFFMGLAVGLFLALLSINIYTKVQSNREQQELSATLWEQSQLLLALQQYSRRRYYNYIHGTVAIAISLL